MSTGIYLLQFEKVENYTQLSILRTLALIALAFQILDGSQHVPEMQLQVDRGLEFFGAEPAQGGLLLDQPRPAQLRVVRQPSLAAGDRTGRAGGCHGALPRYAHVHHFGASEDGHESSGSSTGPRSVAQEGGWLTRLKRIF